MAATPDLTELLAQLDELERQVQTLRTRAQAAGGGGASEPSLAQPFVDLTQHRLD